MINHSTLQGYSLQTTELSGEYAKSVSSDSAPESPSTLVHAFIEWQLASNSFEYAVIAAQSSNRITKYFKANNSLDSLFISRESLKSSYSLIVECALYGFKLIIASTSSKEEFIEFFTRFGYVISIEDKTIAADTLLLRAAWNRSDLSTALELALQRRGNVFCCFAHDADPVYLLTEVVRS